MKEFKQVTATLAAGQVQLMFTSDWLKQQIEGQRVRGRRVSVKVGWVSPSSAPVHHWVTNTASELADEDDEGPVHSSTLGGCAPPSAAASSLLVFLMSNLVGRLATRLQAGD